MRKNCQCLQKQDLFLFVTAEFLSLSQGQSVFKKCIQGILAKFFEFNFFPIAFV